ncbi:MAG: phosphoglycolate phosphatase [Dongiaceae bacterium]
MPRILVFDLDGTLIHSAPDLHRALSQLFAEETLPPHNLEQVISMVGDGSPMLVTRAFERAGRPAGDALPRLLARFLDLYETGIAELTLPYPGVPETLARLRDDGHRMAVCTNKPDGPTRSVLDALGLGSFFEVIVGGDSAPVKKPDARHLLAVLDRMQASPREAVMIGDGTNDLLVAEAVGVPSILVRYGYGLRHSSTTPPAAVIDTFAALPAALARMAVSGAY